MIIINPMKLKDYVTVSHIFCGLASMLAALEGDLAWACIWLFIALIFDTLDGLVARLTKTGNLFGEVFDNVSDLVVYSIAPTIIIFAAYRSLQADGGAGWPAWAAGLLASLPTVFGCIRFARNNVKSIKSEEFHLGYPRPAQAVYLASFFPSHIVLGDWVFETAFPWNEVVYGTIAGLIVLTCLLTLSMTPYHAKPKRPTPMTVFSLVWWLVTTPAGLIVGLWFSDLRIFFDVCVFNLTFYTWFGFIIIPREKKQAVREYAQKIALEWKQEMG